MHLYKFVESLGKSLGRVEDVVGADNPGAQAGQLRDALITPIG